jgi:outer membrane protein assembly factor BamB
LKKLCCWTFLIKQFVLAVFFVLGVVGSLWAGTDDWPMFKNDAGHSAVNSTDVIQAPFNLLWNSSVVVGASNTVAYSSPVMWNTKTYIGGIDGTLYAFAGTVGSQTNPPLWSYKTNGLIYGSPAVSTFGAQDNVYIGATDGNLYCFDSSAAPGTTFLWSVPLGGAIFKSPVIVPEPTATTPVTLVISASHNGVVNAFNAQTGAQYWASPATITSNFLFSSPAYDSSNDQIFEASYDGNLYALHALTGLASWSSPVSVGPTRSSLAVRRLCQSGPKHPFRRRG